MCSKAKKLIGLIYRRYYQYADSNTRLRLYTSLVRPHVEYAAPVWDPSAIQDIQSLEGVQKFALRVCSKQWNSGYSELLDMFSLSTLENRRLYLKLCHLFKIVVACAISHRTLLFPGLTTRTSPDPTYFSSHLLVQTPSTPPSSLTLYESGTSYLRTLYVPRHIVILIGLSEYSLSKNTTLPYFPYFLSPCLSTLRYCYKLYIIII